MATTQQQLKQIDICFDSNSPTGGTTDKPYFILNPPLRNVVGMALQWCNVPCTFYTIDALRNSFTFVVSPPLAAPITLNVEIPPGSYNAVSLAAAITAKLQSMLSDEEYAYDGNANCVFDSTTARFSIYFDQVDEGTTFQLTVTSEDLAPMLGAVAGVTYSNSEGFLFKEGAAVASGNPVWYITLPLVANMQASPLLNLHSSLAPEFNVSSYHTNTSDILQVIPITSNFTTNLIFQSTGLQATFERKPITNATFHFTLQGRDTYAATAAGSNNYTPVDYLPFNGLGFQVSIRFFIDTGNTVIM